MWPFSRRAEARGSLEVPSVPLDAANVAAVLGWGAASETGEAVTRQSALGVPAVWAAVNFISSTIATLPLQLFRRDASGAREPAASDPLYALLHDAPNDDTTSFAWRKHFMTSVLLDGRGFAYIERTRGGRVANLWPLDPRSVAVRRDETGRKFYDYRGPGRAVTYAAAEIVDLPFMPAPDALGHESPTARLANAIGLAIALEKYASKFFFAGGVPPLSLQGPFTSPQAAARAAENVAAMIAEARRKAKNVLPMPPGHELKPIGFDPEKGQLADARRFQVEEIARVYQLSPVFLQDLTRGTFSNTEQQDLHVAKHTLTQWVRALEQELNLKLFGRRNRAQFVEFNLDGLLRGDFATRMAGYASAIQNGIVTPDEARDLENRPRKGGNAGRLFIQGASVPLDAQAAPLDAAEE